MSGPRDYTVATEKALFALAGLSCYFPGCQCPVVTFVEGEPVVNVEIAHIHGAKEGSPRFDATMTDDDRRAFGNLILLCVPHHKYVDRLHPERYPVDMLTDWKTEREKGGAAVLGSIAGITEERLVDLLDQAVAAGAGQRVVVVELALGMQAPGGAITTPEKGFQMLVELQPDLGPPVAIVTVRNRGALPAYVQSYELRFHPVGSGLMGHDDFPYVNPTLPTRLDSGEAKSWMTDLKVVRRLVTAHRAGGFEIRTLGAVANLGSGESVSSNEIDVSVFIDIPLPGDPPQP